MAVREVLVLFTILAGANAWLGEYACENVVQFGSRSDVEQCFQDRFPEPMPEIFLRCAHNSHVSRAYRVLQDYCRDGRFQDEINACMNRDEGATLVTQNVAFRTLRTCLDWIPRSIPDESSESNEDSGRAIRKRDLSENVVDVDEKAPKEAEKVEEEGPRNSEELAEVVTIIVTETFAVPTDAPPIFVTEIVSMAEAVTEATAVDETNEIGKKEEIGEDVSLDTEPNEVVNEISNDIPPAEIENAPSQTDGEGAKDVDLGTDDDENVHLGNDDDEIVDIGNDDDEIVNIGNDDDEIVDLGTDDDDDEIMDLGNDEENSPSEESDKDNTSREYDTDDDNNSANDDSDSSTNDDSSEYDFSFPEFDYPFDFFADDEAYDVDSSLEIINERYNRINFAIYVNKK